MSGGHGDLRARMQRACDRLEERVADVATRSTERHRLAGKLEGVKLAMSYLDDEDRTPAEPADLADLGELERLLEPTLAAYRARVRAECWAEMNAEAAKAGRRSSDKEDDYPDGSAPLAVQRRETECWRRLWAETESKRKTALEAAEQMDSTAELLMRRAANRPVR